MPEQKYPTSLIPHINIDGAISSGLPATFSIEINSITHFGCNFDFTIKAEVQLSENGSLFVSYSSCRDPSLLTGSITRQLLHLNRCAIIDGA